MLDSPLVSIIIANWNGGEVFKNCLRSIKTINYPRWELIIVDNGSIDGSDQFAKKIIPQTHLKLIKNNQNLGFALANNQGYEKAEGKYLLLLNNDTVIDPNFLTLLIQEIESDKSIGIIQPKIYVLDQKDHLDNIGSYLTITGFLQHIGYLARDSEDFNKERYIFSSKGACMLIRKKIVDQIGLFDSDFGTYFEETDFCWRVWLIGYRVLFFPKSKIFHKIGFTSKKQDQSFIFYHSSKNRICSLIKNLNLSNLIYIGSIHIIINVLLCLYYLLTFKLNRAIMIWKAIFWNVINLKSTVRKRKIIQHKRQLTDKQIFKYILVSLNLTEMIKHFVKVEANFK